MTAIRPVRLQLSRARGFRLQEVSRAANGLPARSVARPARWGNRYIIGERIEHVDDRTHFVADAETAVRLYREWLDWQMATFKTMHEGMRWEIGGRNLACWCPLDQPHCHAAVLLEVANR